MSAIRKNDAGADRENRMQKLKMKYFVAGELPAMTDENTLYRLSSFREASGPTLRPGGLKLTSRALELCGVSANSHTGRCVLDVGCGGGATLSLLLRMGCTVTGLDSDSGMIEEARRATGGGADIRYGKAEMLPVSDSSQDIVLCECVLSLCRDKRRVIAECSRVLRPGGYFILTDIVRENEAAGGSDTLNESVQSCLKGAVSQSVLREMMVQEGLQITHEERVDRALSELGARLILGGETLCGLSRWLGIDCAGGTLSRNVLRSLGYVLMTARKEES